ncbi:MAG TPA: sodium:proton antiporter, partial [Planctomycetes bacterium]|nr:sodium:proton antiporter [Planctomycetota bacterium]
QPWHFFWMTGGLSSFLDNTPTYVVYFSLAGSPELAPTLHAAFGAPPPSLAHVGIPQIILEAISVGAVFMGANTYIGNAPNFMVKVIAEERKIKMPSFFGYMLWSGLILIPLFVLVNLIWFL